MRAESSNPYSVSLSKAVLTMLDICKVSADDAVDFFTEQVESMLQVEPNLKFGSKRGLAKSAVNKSSAWVMRGYYPGTPIPFKITVTPTKDNEYLSFIEAPYFVKITLISPKHSVVGLSGSVLRKRYMDRMFENSLLNGKSDIPSLLPELKVKRPKCMSPKGVPLHKPKVCK